MPERIAFLSITISVLLYSFFPLFNAFSVSVVSPFIYVAKASFIGGLICVAIFKLLPSDHGNEKFVDAIKRTKFGWVMISPILAVLGYVALIKSFYIASNTAVTILYELWPVIVLFFMPLLHKGRFADLKGIDVAGVLLALAGVYFILVSSQKSSNPFDIDISAGSQSQGLLLALVSCFVMAAAVLCKSKGMISIRPQDLKLGSFVSLEIVNRFSGAAFAGVLALLFEDNLYEQIFQFDSSFGFGVIEGVAGLFYWFALNKSKKSTIQLLLYVSPLISFVWLYFMGVAQLSSLILFGAMMIFSANVLVHYDKDRSYAFIFTVVFSIVSCIYCYFTTGTQGTLIFALLGIPTTLFAILIGFMLERISRKDRKQQDLALDLLMSEKRQLKAEGRRVFNRVLVNSFESDDWGSDDAERHTFVKLIENLNKRERVLFESFVLARSNPLLAGEMMVLTLVGLSAILASHFVRPVHFFGDFFPAILTATVVYLCLTVVEQRNYIIRETLDSIRLRLEGNPIILKQQKYEMVSSGLFLLISILSIFIIALLEKYQIISF